MNELSHLERSGERCERAYRRHVTSADRSVTGGVTVANGLSSSERLSDSFNSIRLNYTPNTLAMFDEGDTHIAKALAVLLVPLVTILLFSQVSLPDGQLPPGTGAVLLIAPLIAILFSSVLITVINIVRAWRFSYERGLLDILEHVCGFGVVLSLVSLLIGLDPNHFVSRVWTGIHIKVSLWGFLLLLGLQFLLALSRGVKTVVVRYWLSQA